MNTPIPAPWICPLCGQANAPHSLTCPCRSGSKPPTVPWVPPIIPEPWKKPPTVPPNPWEKDPTTAPWNMPWHPLDPPIWSELMGPGDQAPFTPTVICTVTPAVWGAESKQVSTEAPNWGGLNR